MNYHEYFDENGWLKDEYLWPLRKDIVLGSLYVSDYENRIGIDAKMVYDFFTSFWDSYVKELWDDPKWRNRIIKAAIDYRYAKHPGMVVTEREINHVLNRINTGAVAWIEKELFDNEIVLLEWYHCFADNPFPRRKYEVFLQGLVDNNESGEKYNEWDVEETLHVMAYCEKQAEGIVQEAIVNGSLLSWPNIELVSELHSELKPGRWIFNLTLSSSLIE